MLNVGNNPIAAAAQGGAGATTSAVSGGGPAPQKDSAESSTAPKFGQLLEQIQAKYGEKPKEQREIKKTLGKDDFLRIMITQMKNQDPTSPFKADQMAAQMAQFASVEQMQNVNATLGKMVSQNKATDRIAMTSMIGKTVTVDRERFPHTQGSNEALTFTLPKEAAMVKVAVISADTGETVLEKELGPAKAGENGFTWDGKNVSTLPAKTGSYMLKVDAKDDRGAPIQTNPQSRARVIGVSFEGGEPVLLVGDNRHQDKVTMQNVIRIEDAAGPVAGIPMSAAPEGPAGAAPAPGQPAPNFIAFQKGVGSSNLDAAKVAPQVAAALSQFQAEQGRDSAEKGFPNGLHDSDEPAPKSQPAGGGVAPNPQPGNNLERR